MVRTVRPRSYDEVIYVGRYFREGIPVVMDLNWAPDADAMHLVDFAAGLVVGRGGAMERVAPGVFLLKPGGGVDPPGNAEARVKAPQVRAEPGVKAGPRLRTGPTVRVEPGVRI